MKTFIRDAVGVVGTRSTDLIDIEELEPRIAPGIFSYFRWGDVKIEPEHSLTSSPIGIEPEHS